MGQGNVRKDIGRQDVSRERKTLWLRKEVIGLIEEYAEKRLARARSGRLGLSSAVETLMLVAFKCITNHQDFEEDEPERTTWQEARQARLSIIKKPHKTKTATLVGGKRVYDPDGDEI